MEDRLGPVEIAGELRQATIKPKDILTLGSLVFEADFKTGVEEGQLAEMADQEIRVVLENREDLGVRLEVDECAGSAGFSDRL